MKQFLSLMIFLSLAFSLNLRAETNTSAELPRDSFYQLPLQWRNQNDEVKDLKSWAGHPVVIAMTFTGCQYSCPMTIQKILDIEKDLQKAGVLDYQVVLASFDTVRDQPEVLKAYMKKRKLDEGHWTFLTAATDSQVRELAVLLNINYQKMENGDFSHSNGISLLDPQGRLALQLKGLASDHKELVQKVASYGKQK